MTKKGRKENKLNQNKTNRELFVLFDLTPTKKDIRYELRCKKVK